MRVAYISAGAGGMFCGACARDANLARALLGRGCELTLVPLYTPLKLDSPPPPCTTRLFFGGINISLKRRLPALIRVPWLLERILDNEVLLLVASEFGIDTKPERLGELAVAMLRVHDGPLRKELDRLLGFLDKRARPDLVNLTNSLLSGLAGPIKRRLNVPVVCTLQGEDDFVETMPDPHRMEARKLLFENAREVDAFISPGSEYADRMAAFLGVPREKISVIRTGIRAQDYPPARAAGSGPFVIGHLSRFTPGKGLDLLLEAFRIIVRERGLDARLHAAGQILDADFWKSNRSFLRQNDLAARFRHYEPGSLAGKVAFLGGCSVFALASRYPEVNATALLEALASGLPAVAPDAGAFREIINLTGGGVLFPPGDAKGLADALAGLMDEPDRREAMALAAREGIRKHYSADQMAEETLCLYKRMARV